MICTMYLDTAKYTTLISIINTMKSSFKKENITLYPYPQDGYHAMICFESSNLKLSLKNVIADFILQD